MPAKPAASSIFLPASAPLRCVWLKTRGLRPPTASPRQSKRCSRQRVKRAALSPWMPTELKDFDAVVFDPPRQGAEAQARELGKSTVPIVVAVSCDANTFARDAKILVDAGYRLAAVTPIDQFRYSHHIEIVAKFTR